MSKAKTDAIAELPVPLGTAPMEARLADALPVGSGWQYEPKWDGFRCLAFRAGAAVELRAKSGKSLTRYFPEVTESLRAVPPRRFVVDGELVIPLGRSLSFDGLQMRLHPAASRVRRLAADTPARLVIFDLLMDSHGRALLDAPLHERRAALEAFHRQTGGTPQLRLSPFTRTRRTAEAWLARAGGALDGVVAKEIDGRYLPGVRAMVKVKRQRTADCVIGGFRYASDSDQVGSLLLGLYNHEGKLDHVGFTSTISADGRAALTRRLEKLIAAPGFTGDAPGGPSRWQTGRSAEWQPLRPKLVVEVRYDHVTGKRLRHGAKLLRWRPDKAPRQCTFDQIERPGRPAALLRDVIEG